MLPLAWGGSNHYTNIVWLCPTSHTNVHELLSAYRNEGGTPPWEVRRHFNPYIRELARRGWEKYRALA